MGGKLEDLQAVWHSGPILLPSRPENDFKTEERRKKEKEAKARGTAPPKLGPVTALPQNTDFENNASPEGNPVIIKENGV